MSVRAIGRTEKDGKTGSEAYAVTEGKALSIGHVTQVDHVRVMSNAQAAVAEAIETFGRIDILLCNTSEGI